MKKIVIAAGSEPLARADWEAFARQLATGKTSRSAYLAVYPAKSGWCRAKIEASASRMRRRPVVRARINYLVNAAAAETIRGIVASREEVAQTMTEILRASHSDFLTMSADGVWHHDVGPETLNRAALKRLRTRITGGETGDGIMQIDEIELESKIHAARTLADLMGYNAKQQLEHSGAITVLHSMPMSDGMSRNDDNDND